MNRTAKIWLLFAGILVFASFLRLYHITTTPPGLYPDEAADGNSALQVIQTGHFKVFYTGDNGREGLYVNTLVFFIRAFGNKPWVVRLPAVAAGIATVAGMYFLGAELFGAEAGLLAAFLLATCFWHIDLSRVGFRAIMAPLFMVWTLFVFLRALRSPKPWRGAMLSALAGLLFAVGFYTYIAYRIMPLLFLLFIPFFRKHPLFWRNTAIFIAVAFLVALPLGLYFLDHAGSFFGRTSEISVTSTSAPLAVFGGNVLKTLGMFNFRGDGNWRQNIAGAPEFFLPVGFFFLFGIGLAIFSLWRSRQKRKNERLPDAPYPAFGILLIFGWFLLGIIPAAASDEGIPHALRTILALPPAIFLAAIGGIFAYRAIRAGGFRKTALALSLVFIILVGINAFTSYFIVWAKNPNVAGAFNSDYVAIGDAINALPAGVPKYVVVNAGGVMERGVPVPAQTVMFVTDSFTSSTRRARNITYLLPDQIGSIPATAPSDTIFYVNN